VNNNQFGALHFINAPYKIGDRTLPKRAHSQKWSHFQKPKRSRFKFWVYVRRSHFQKPKRSHF